MFFQKNQVACVVTKDLALLYVVFKRYKVTDNFLIFRAGNMRRSFEEKPTPFKELLLSVETVSIITIL